MQNSYLTSDPVLLGPLKFSDVTSIVQYMTGTERFTVLASLNRHWRQYVFSSDFVPVLSRKIFAKGAHDLDKVMNLFASLENMRVQGLQGNQITSQLVSKLHGVKSLEIQNLILTSREWARLKSASVFENHLTSLHVQCPPRSEVPKFYKFNKLQVLKIDCMPDHLFQMLPLPMNLEELEINLRMPRGFKAKHHHEVFHLNLAKLSKLKSLMIRKCFWGLPFDLNLVNLHDEIEVLRLINVELQNVNEVVSQAKHVRHLQISSKVQCYSKLLSHLYPGKENEKFIHNRLPSLSVLKFKCHKGTLTDEIMVPHSLLQLEVTLAEQESQASELIYGFNFAHSNKLKALALVDQSRDPRTKAAFHFIEPPRTLREVRFKQVNLQDIGKVLKKQKKLRNLELDSVALDIDLVYLPAKLKRLALINKQPLEVKPVIKDLEHLESLTLQLGLAEKYFEVKDLPGLEILELKSLPQSTLLLNIPRLTTLGIKQSTFSVLPGATLEMSILNEGCCVDLKGIQLFVQNDLLRSVKLDNTLCGSILRPLQGELTNLRSVKVQFKCDKLAEFIESIDRSAVNLEELQITKVPKIVKGKDIHLTNRNLRVLKIETFGTFFCELPLVITESCYRLESVSLTSSLVKLAVHSPLLNLQLNCHVLDLQIRPTLKVKNLKLALESVHDNPFLKSKTDSIHKEGFNFLSQVQNATLLLRVNEPVEFSSEYLALRRVQFALCQEQSALILENLTASCPNLKEIEVHSVQSNERCLTVLGKSVQEIDLFEAEDIECLRVETPNEIKVNQRNSSFKILQIQ